MYNTNKIKCILFDMDGTVLESESLFDSAQIKLLSDFGIRASNVDLQDFKGLSHKHFYPAFKEKFNLDQDIKLLRGALRTYLHELMESNLEYVKGFKDFYLDIICGYNIKCGLVTNTTRRTYEKIRESTNIGDYFPLVITSTEAIQPKPSPHPYIQAMSELNSKIQETAIIEDSSVGLLSALKSGAHVFGITSSLNAAQISEISQDIVIVETYNELKSFLLDLL